MGKQAQSLSRTVTNYLTLHGFFCWKGGTAAVRLAEGRFARFGQVGGGDLYAIRAGQLLCLELKASKGDRVRPEQAEFGRQIISHGGRYLVVRSLDDVIAMLEIAP